ncbi:MAG: response regulator transcription factor [Actinomycetales bacterium]|nr:response regulator transcription factor [Actinomycetales bacterium]
MTAHDGDGSPLTVLVVEDEAAIRRVVVSYLQQDGFDVIESADGIDAVARARAEAPGVIVLDLGLPGLDGIEVCRRLRTFTDAYVIMLTARSDEVDKLIGLSVGADDYLTKPFSARELVARIHVMLRRPRNTSDDTTQQVRVFGDLRVDPEAREVTLAGKLVSLTRTEFDILDVLSAHPRRVHSRAVLVDQVWGQGWVGDERIVDVHIAHLRAKLGDASSEPAYIRTVRGVGFRMGDG